jgi:MYXO-CTERM domain-containing protein
MATKLPIAFGLALLCAAQPGGAHAYSDPTLYAEPVGIGGGGGRWFTGSSADGYACDVCHTGGSGTDLTISGLPLDGFVPGGRYEVAIGWPANAQLALVAEFTDEQRQGAGTIDLPRPETTKPFERCSMEEGGGGLPTMLFDAEASRRLFTVLDCGAQSTRFRWTAPAAASGTLWFNLGFVASNEDAKPSGDGVTLVRRALRAAGAADPRIIAQGCGTTGSAGSRAAATSWMLAVVGVGWLLRVRRSREVP